MSVSANALTLQQYALMSNEPMVQAVTFSLIEAGNVLQDIPMVNKASLVANGTRFEGNLPSVSWVSLNEEGVTTSGTPTPFQEQAYIIRNNIDTDRYLVMDENQIADPRGVQAAAYLKSVTFDFNHKFINNNHSSGDEKAIVGLRARLDNPTIYGCRSENKIDAGGVDMRLANRTAKTFATFVEYLDQLLWSVDSPDGTNVVLYMNEVMIRRMSGAAAEFSGAGGFSQAADQFGRTIMSFKNAVIRDIGYKADQSTRIITTTEDTAGADGSSTYTSIYAVRYDMEHMMGWQFEPLVAKDLGLLENGSIYRTFIDWAGGLYPASNRCIGRVYGIRLA